MESHTAEEAGGPFQQLDIILTLICQVLASGQPLSLAYSKGELWNSRWQHSTARVHIAMPTGSTSEVGTPLYSGHFR